MGYKMKGYSYPGTSPLKQEIPKKHDLGGVGKMYVDVSTQEGRDIVKRYQNTPTIRSSDPSRVTKNYKSSNIIKDFVSKSTKSSQFQSDMPKGWDINKDVRRDAKQLGTKDTSGDVRSKLDKKTKRGSKIQVNVQAHRSYLKGKNVGMAGKTLRGAVSGSSKLIPVAGLMMTAYDFLPGETPKEKLGGLARDLTSGPRSIKKAAKEKSLKPIMENIGNPFQKGGALNLFGRPKNKKK